MSETCKKYTVITLTMSLWLITWNVGRSCEFYKMTVSIPCKLLMKGPTVLLRLLQIPGTWGPWGNYGINLIHFHCLILTEKRKGRFETAYFI